MSLNNYNLLKELCEKSFNKFKCDVLNNQEITFYQENEKERIGFYYFIIEKVTGCSDYKAINKMICDGNYIREITGTQIEDNGIDAICVDNAKHVVSVFNFKYRKYSDGSCQGETDLKASDTFLNMIKNQNISGMQSPQLELAQKILNTLNDTSSERWNYNLYFVSNQEKMLNSENPERLRITKERYSRDYCFDLKLITLQNLPKICGFGHKEVNSKFISLKSDYIKGKSGETKSYIFTISLATLLKISCNNEEIRMNDRLDDINQLASVSNDKDSLYENVRGLIKKSEINSEIEKTVLDDDKHFNFFLFNNGVTMIASKVEENDRNMQQSTITLNNLQIVNGGQTVKTLFEFAKKGQKLSHLDRAKILLRVFEVKGKPGEFVNDLGNDIARFTNSQNAIDNIDLKSLDKTQFEIEQVLNFSGIRYIRKRGSTDDENENNFEFSISSLNLGQLLWSIKGSPHKISNNRKQLFGKTYDEVFKNNVDYLKIPEYVLKFQSLKQMEELKTINGGKNPSNQEIFYLAYSVFNFPVGSVTDLYTELKELYRSYKDVETTCNRPYIKSDFFGKWKEHLINKYTSVSNEQSSEQETIAENTDA